MHRFRARISIIAMYQALGYQALGLRSLKSSRNIIQRTVVRKKREARFTVHRGAKAFQLGPRVRGCPTSFNVPIRQRGFGSSLDLGMCCLIVSRRTFDTIAI